MFTQQDGGPKEKNNDRILELEIMEGKDALSSLGIVDKRLFTGENKLHAVMDPQSLMWHFKYDMGGLPEQLKGQFSKFIIAKEHAEAYFKNRNIRIKNVID